MTMGIGIDLMVIYLVYRVNSLEMSFFGRFFVKQMPKFREGISNSECNWVGGFKNVNF